MDLSIMLTRLKDLSHKDKKKALIDWQTYGYDEDGDILLAYFDNNEVIALLPYDRVLRLKRI